MLAYSVYTAVLVPIAFIDLRHRYVYSAFVYPPLALALALTPLLAGETFLATVLGLGFGTAFFAAVYALGRLAYRSEAVGKGDIELAALVGAMVAFPGVLGALFLGSLANGAAVAALLLLRRRGRRDFVPYGPGLCAGAYLAFLLP